MDSGVVHLLESLSSPNNEVRSSAESYLTGLQNTNLSDLSQQLIECTMAAIIPPHLRSLAAIVLRRILVDNTTGYDQIENDRKDLLRSRLFTALVNENDYKIRQHICDIIGKLAAIVLIEISAWAEILPFTHQLLQSQNVMDRESGLNLLEWLFSSHSYLEVLLAPSNIPAVVFTLKTSLKDHRNSGSIALAAIKALSVMVTRVRSEAVVDQLQDIAPDVVGTLQVLVKSTPEISENICCDYLACMTDVAAERSTFFGGTQLAITVSILITLLEPSSSHSITLNVRNQLVEFLTTMCEACPREMRRLSGQEAVASRLLPVLAHFMAQLPEEASLLPWNDGSDDYEEEDDDEIDGNGSALVVAEDAYDRVTTALGLRTTFPLVMTQLQALVSPSWQQRNAAALILANYLEISAGLKDKAALTQHVSDVASHLGRLSTSDPSTRVRNSAFFAVTQLLAILGSKLNEAQHNVLLDASVGNICCSAAAAPRLRRSALTAIINQLDLLPEHMLEAHAPRILQQTVAALSEGPLMVQERCVSVLVRLAQVMRGERAFAQFYDVIMPILQQLLTYAQEKSIASLWGQALECYAIVGESAGPDKFKPDAMKMMTALVQMQQSDTVPQAYHSDAQSYILKVWVRIARCLGADFLPFLPLVAEKILPVLRIDLTAGTGDVDLDDPSLETRSDIDILETNDGFLVVRTSAVEEQGSACELLRLLIASTQENFYPYSEPAVRAIIPLLRSPHEDIRTLSLVVVPELARCIAKTGLRDPLTQFLQCVLGEVIETLQSEGVLEIIMTGLQVLRRTQQYSSTDWVRFLAGGYEYKDEEGEREPVLTPSTCVPVLTAEQLGALSTCAKTALRDSLQRRAVMRAEATIHGKDEDDEDEEQDFMAFSMEMHFNVCEMVGSLLCTHSALFFPIYLSEWHPMVCDLVHPHCLKEDRVIACSLLADVFVYGFTDGQDVGGFFAPIMSPLIDCCANGQTAALRRCAAFAIGTAADRFSASFTSFIPAALAALAKCISQGHDGAPRGSATDNAVMAVGTILQAISGLGNDYAIYLIAAGFDVRTLWGQWLAYLPMTHDVDEGRRVARQLCRLLSQQDSYLFTSADRIHKAVAVLIQVCSNSALTNDDLSGSICSLLRGLCASQSEAQLDALKNSIGPDLSTTLFHYLLRE